MDLIRLTGTEQIGQPTAQTPAITLVVGTSEPRHMGLAVNGAVGAGRTHFGSMAAPDVKQGIRIILANQSLHVSTQRAELSTIAKKLTC